MVDAYTQGQAPLAHGVYAISTAAMTAQETAHKIKANRGYTIEGFTAAVHHGAVRPTERAVLVVDEYVMVDTFRAAELLQAAGDAHIICVGDPRQLQGIGASGWQADVQAALAARGQEAVELTHVHRQTQAADRQMLAAERTGAAQVALQNLAARGRFHLAQTPEQADGAVLDAYRRLRDEGRAVGGIFVNTDTTNARVDTYNRLIQDDRLRRGEIGGAHIDYRSTTANRHETLYVGDRVALVKGLEDNGQRVANGRKGTIARIDEDHRRVVVRLDDGTAVRVDVPVAEPMVPIRLCYAGHACRLQGAEAPVVLVVPGNGTTSLESAYSALSRGQEEIHVFADTTTHGPDPLTRLSARWHAPDPKRTATARAREQADLMTTGELREQVAADVWAMHRSFAEVPSAPIDGPASRRQKGYLADLARQAGEEMPTGLTRRQATAAITELQERISRPVPDWARSLPAPRPAPESTQESQPARESQLAQGPEITSPGVASDPLDALAAQAVAAAETARHQRIQAALGSEPAPEQGPELDLGLSRQRRLDPPWHPDIPPGT